MKLKTKKLLNNTSSIIVYSVTVFLIIFWIIISISKKIVNRKGIQKYNFRSNLSCLKSKNADAHCVQICTSTSRILRNLFDLSNITRKMCIY